MQSKENGMLGRNRKPLILLLTLVSVLYAQSSHAILLQYVATDLTDATLGEDLWRYDYNVSGATFPEDYGFQITFDYTLYSGLQDPPMAVNADWDVVSVQPDAFFGADGFYDALSIATNASLADPFSLTFIWLGGSGRTPGAQPFEVYDDTFAPVETGTTVAAQSVPAPAPWSLMLLVAPYLATRRKGVVRPSTSP
jgi:hypothetical protein